jgi:hypothetical protein
MSKGIFKPKSEHVDKRASDSKSQKKTLAIKKQN